MKQKIQKQNGFSILEVIISILIIGVILVLYQASLNSILLIKNAQDQGLALRIATNKMEELRGTGYASLPASGSFTNSLLSSLNSGTANMTITSFNAKTKEVNVVVTWQEHGSVNPHSVSLTTLISEVGGLQ